MVSGRIAEAYLRQREVVAVLITGAGEAEGSFGGSRVAGGGCGAGVLEVDGGGTDEGVAGGLVAIGGTFG